MNTRREFIALLGGAAAAWPVVASAQQPPMPVVGFINGASAKDWAPMTAAFRRGLAEIGFVEGRNVVIEERWADGHYYRLPELAAELVARKVAVISASGGVSSVLATKAATDTIPIVFANGSDPLKFGLVASFNRPGGNITGVTFFNNNLGSKRLQMLRELLPKARTVAVMVNPGNPNTESDLADIQSAAGVLAMEIRRVNAVSASELDTALASLANQRPDALIINPDAFFFSRRQQVVTLVSQQALPAMYELRAWVEAGGLVSYGTSITDAYRAAGVYVGRILRGEKPAELPVQQSTRFELVVNGATANALGLALPPSLLALADEVIE